MLTLAKELYEKPQTISHYQAIIQAVRSQQTIITTITSSNQQKKAQKTDIIHLPQPTLKSLTSITLTSPSKNKAPSLDFTQDKYTITFKEGKTNKRQQQTERDLHQVPMWYPYRASQIYNNLCKCGNVLLLNKRVVVVSRGKKFCYKE